MQTPFQLTGEQEINYVTPRKFVSLLFHHPKIAIWTFSLVFGIAIVLAIVQKPVYRCQMTFLINMERTDPLVTTDASLVPKTVPGITDAAINSELQLLKSQDLLREVVIACNLQSIEGKSAFGLLRRRLARSSTADPNPNAAIARAALTLQRNMSVELIPKTSMIRLSYVSPDPQLSAKVLKTYSELYLKKHVAVRRPVGTFDFFKQEADRYHEQVAKGERDLENFASTNNVASLETEKSTTFKKLTELEVSRRETQASIRVTGQRIRTLRTQMADVPPRFTTQVRKESGRPPDQLQSTLLTLELKRSELTGVFQPDYPAVKEIEKQIAEAKAALAASQERFVIEETTDRDPAHEWLRIELEKAEVELIELKSKENAIAAMIGQFGEKAARLNNLEARYNDLTRSLKLAEASYITYYNKQEQARVSDALDAQRILNVAVADSPFLPTLPSKNPASIVLLIGLVTAVVFSSCFAFVAERIDSPLRTPHDVEKSLGLRVVAAIPERLD